MINNNNKLDISSDDDTPIISPGEFIGNLSHLAELPEYLEKVNQNILNIDKKISKKRISSSKPKDYEKFHSLKNKYLNDEEPEIVNYHNSIKSNCDNGFKCDIINNEENSKQKKNLDNNNNINMNKFIKPYNEKEINPLNSLKKKKFNKSNTINTENFQKMKNSFDKKKTLNNNSLSQSNINIRINSNLRKSSNLSEGRYNNGEEFKKQNSLNKLEVLSFEKNKSYYLKNPLNKSYQIQPKKKLKNPDLSVTLTSKLDKSISKESDKPIKNFKPTKFINIDSNKSDHKKVKKNKLIKNSEKENIIVKKISPLKININKSNYPLLSHKNNSQQTSTFSNILMPKNINIHDIMKMILFYNEYIISHMEINENDKNIFNEFSSFLSKKIMQEKKQKVNLIDIDKRSQKNKNVIIIQRYWRKYYINKILENKNLKIEMKRNIIDNFIEKDVYETKKLITSLNFSFDNFTSTRDVENISIKLSKINEGKYDLKDKYILYKEYINSYLKKEKENLKDEKIEKTNSEENNSSR